MFMIWCRKNTKRGQSYKFSRFPQFAEKILFSVARERKASPKFHLLIHRINLHWYAYEKLRLVCTITLQ